MADLMQLDQLTHHYRQVCALSNVNLKLPHGAIGLVGQNGAGKSTLLQILLGLIQPTEGTVHILGQDVRTAGVSLRGRLGYMSERDAFVPGLYGIEYVALAGCLSGMPQRQALRRAHETLSYLGLEEARYRRLEQYSVGMKQRLKLAATLVHDPDLLLLDEPTAGLDPDGRAAMLNVLESLARRCGKSLILSSHLLGDIERVCRWAVILNQGQVLHAGRIEELRTRKQRAYRLQWDGEGEGFLTRLREAGVETEVGKRQGEIQVTVPPAWSTQKFFAIALEQQVQLTGIEPEEEDLNAVYRKLIAD